MVMGPVSPFASAADLAAHAQSRFGIVFTDSRAEEVFKKSAKAGDWSWSHGTWDMWLKNRIAESPGWGNAIGMKYADCRITCELHMGFTQIEETPLMLARLKNERPKLRADDPTRSRLRDYLAQIRPVDRVASRVVAMSGGGQ